jgi:hypothetical protein
VTLLPEQDNRMNRLLATVSGEMSRSSTYAEVTTSEQRRGMPSDRCRDHEAFEVAAACSCRSCDSFESEDGFAAEEGRKKEVSARSRGRHLGLFINDIDRTSTAHFPCSCALVFSLMKNGR